MRGFVLQYFGIDHSLHFGNFILSHRCIVGKIEAGFVGIDQRAFLLHMLAQHVTQRLVHEMRHRMMAHGALALVHVHVGGNGIANGEFAGGDGAVMAEYIRLDFLRVLHLEQSQAGTTLAEFAAVTHLATGLGVERCFVQHHDTFVSRRQTIHQ